MNTSYLRFSSQAWWEPGLDIRAPTPDVWRLLKAESNPKNWYRVPEVKIWPKNSCFFYKKEGLLEGSSDCGSIWAEDQRAAEKLITICLMWTLNYEDT